MIPIRDANPRHATPVVSWVIVALNVLVFVYQTVLGESRAAYEFIFEYAFIPARFAEEPVAALHTLVTSEFMHGSWMHLLSNMIFLIVFADNVEDRMGRWRFALFYLLGAAAATAAHGLFSAGSTVPLVGASGAVSAVLGAYILLYPQQRVQTFIPPLIIPWLLASLFGRFPRLALGLFALQLFDFLPLVGQERFPLGQLGLHVGGSSLCFLEQGLLIHLVLCQLLFGGLDLVTVDSHLLKNIGIATPQAHEQIKAIEEIRQRLGTKQGLD